ncbi:TPA: hypothetical protein ACSCYS_003448 [Aeromonas veronii]
MSDSDKETPLNTPLQSSKNGLFMGHYQAPALSPSQHYCCAKCGEPCDTLTSVVRKNHDDTTVYRKVDGSSCCHGTLTIWDAEKREMQPCRLSLFMPPEHGVCLGHYKAPPLQPEQLYCCSMHGEDCDVQVIVEDNVVVSNKDGVIIRREYSLVDVASCCEADLQIRNAHDDNDVDCELTLHPC